MEHWKGSKRSLIAIAVIILLIVTSCKTLNSDGVKKVIVDCDMSYMSDDALALSMLVGEHKKGNIEILGITLEGGNTLIEASYETPYEKCKGSLEYTVELLEELGEEDIPVVIGTDLPIGVSKDEMSELTSYYNSLDSLLEWDSTWGALRYFNTVEPDSFVDSDEASDFLISQTEKYPGEITIFAIGPVMNIARAVNKDSSFASRVEAVYYMCGAFGEKYEALAADGRTIEAINGANVSVYSEYNAVYDPQSLAVCLCADFPVMYICPGELNVSIDNTTAELFRESDSEIIKLWADLYETYIPDCPYWDPLTVAAFIEPESVKGYRAYVSINTDKESPEFGMTSAITEEEYTRLPSSEKQNWAEALIVTEVSNFRKTALESMTY